MIELLQSYYKGEQYQAIGFCLLGILLIVLCFLLWNERANNEMVKGIFYPLAFLALMGSLIGGYGIYNNMQRLKNLPIEYQTDSKVFIEKEFKRFEGDGGVNSFWRPLKLVWLGLILSGLIIYFISKKELLLGIALGVVIIGTVGMVIDGFAEHRAKVYTETLIKSR